MLLKPSLASEKEIDCKVIFQNQHFELERQNIKREIYLNCGDGEDGHKGYVHKLYAKVPIYLLITSHTQSKVFIPAYAYWSSQKGNKSYIFVCLVQGRVGV